MNAAVADPRGGEQPIAVFEGVAARVLDRGAARVLDRGAARVRGRATVPFSAKGGWWVSDPRLAVRWRQVDLDDAPPYLPVIPGRVHAVERRDGSFPLYVDQQLPRVKKRTRKKARRAVERITRATSFEVSTLCEGRV